MHRSRNLVNLHFRVALKIHKGKAHPQYLVLLWMPIGDWAHGSLMSSEWVVR